MLKNLHYKRNRILPFHVVATPEFSSHAPSSRVSISAFAVTPNMAHTTDA